MSFGSRKTPECRVLSSAQRDTQTVVAPGQPALCGALGAGSPTYWQCGARVLGAGSPTLAVWSPDARFPVGLHLPVRLPPWPPGPGAPWALMCGPVRKPDLVPSSPGFWNRELGGRQTSKATQPLQESGLWAGGGGLELSTVCGFCFDSFNTCWQLFGQSGVD